jgi:ribosomal protein L7/L12
MEIYVIGGVAGFIVVLFIVRWVMTNGERHTPGGYYGPHLDELPSAFTGNVPGGDEVTIRQVGPKKIEVIKVIRQHTGLGLKEAKELADYAARTPVIVANNLSTPVAADFRRGLEEAGATVGDGSRQYVATSTSMSSVTLQIEWIDVGPKKIEVIKVIREYTLWGLKEATEATETPSFMVTMPEDRATQFLIALREAGAVANVHGL